MMEKCKEKQIADLMDARLALEEIRQGNAQGSKISLWGRAIVERGFEAIGFYIASKGPTVAIGIFAMTIAVCVVFASGLREAEIETDETKLWVDEGGRLEEEMQYTDEHLHPDLQPTSEIVLHTTTEGNLTASLLDHLDFLQKANAIQVRHKYMTYTLKDICYKNDFGSTTVDVLDRILDHLNPCIIVTPLDCFWEGSLLHNPPKPVAPPELCPTIPNITWSNLNVTDLQTCLRNNYFQFNSLVEEGLVKAGVEGYINKPCITNRSDCPNQAKEPLREELYGGCSGFASEAMKWPEQITIGGKAFRQREPGVDPQALQTIIQLSGPRTLMVKFNDSHNSYWNLEDYKTLLTKWKTELIELMKDYENNKERLTNEDIYVWTSDSASRVVEIFSDINPLLVVVGYLLMLVYCAFAFSRLHPVKSRANVGLVGLLLVVAASSAALGLCSYIGLDLNATSTQVLPFLVLGLGVDDMFVIADEFFELESKAEPYTPIRTLISKTLRKVGPSITLTSITNSSGFFLAAIIPIPAMRVFALQVGIAIVFNYFGLLFGLPSYLVIDTLRVHEKLIDTFCCIPWRWFTCSFQNANNEDDDDSIYDFISSHATSRNTFLGSSLDGKMEPVSPIRKGSVVGSRLAHGISTNSMAEDIPSQFLVKYADKPSFLTYLVINYYSPCLQNYVIKGVIIALFVCIFGLSIYGATTVQDGLNLVDVLPKDTPEYGFVNSTLNYFAFYDIYISTKQMDYAHRQKELIEMYHAVHKQPKVVKDGSTQFWLEAMINYFIDIKEEYCAAPHEVSALQETLLAALIKTFNTSKTFLDVRNDLDNCTFSFVETRGNISVIPEDQFYRLITLWVALDPVNAGTARPEFQPPVPEWSPTVLSVGQLAATGNITAAEPFVFTQIPMYVENLQDTDDYKNLIVEVRSILEQSESQGVFAYPRGIPFTFWEQYIKLRERVLTSCALILVASLIASSIFFMSLIGAIILVLMLALTAFEVFGFMGLAGIHFSAVPAVVVIVSVGVAVEYTAPMIFYFLKATSCKDERKTNKKPIIRFFRYFYDALEINNDRMHQALMHRFTPIFNGGISTLLGIVMLAFTPFPFIRKYFFFILLNLLIVGALNGLVLLPVVLSLIGPPPQVRPIKVEADKTDYEDEVKEMSRNSSFHLKETLV